MAYLGHFEKFISIDGEPVDLSRIDEGIIMAGDEEYDADEMITDEDRLDVFNETALTTQDELVKSLDEVIGKIEEESKTDKEHSPAFYARYKELVVQFRDKIRKMTFPSKLEDWWRTLRLKVQIITSSPLPTHFTKKTIICRGLLHILHCCLLGRLCLIRELIQGLAFT